MPRLGFLFAFLPPFIFFFLTLWACPYILFYFSRVLCSQFALLASVLSHTLNTRKEVRGKGRGKKAKKAFLACQCFSHRKEFSLFLPYVCLFVNLSTTDFCLNFYCLPSLLLLFSFYVLL